MASDQNERETVARRRQQIAEVLQQRARRAAEQAKQAGDAAASGAAQAATQRGKRAAKKAVTDAARGNIDADEFVDRRKKSRNQKIAERAQAAAQIRSPMSTSLRTVGDERVVTEMARAPAADGATLLGASDNDESVGLGMSLLRFDAFSGVGLSGDNDGADLEGSDGALAFDDPFGLTGSDDGGDGQ